MPGASVLLLRACLALLAMPIYLLNVLGIWGPFCKKVFFPYFLEKLGTIHEGKAKKYKQELFRNLPDFARPSGELKLLEIGTGCGANFQFYPPGCKVTCTDINPNFQQSLLRSMKKNQHIQYEDFLVAAGEDLHQVPSGSMDAVICTLVLCSVRSLNDTLKEVLRVLRPVSICPGSVLLPRASSPEALHQQKEKKTVGFELPQQAPFISPRPLCAATWCKAAATDGSVCPSLSQSVPVLEVNP